MTNPIKQGAVSYLQWLPLELRHEIYFLMTENFHSYFMHQTFWEQIRIAAQLYLTD